MALRGPKHVDSHIIKYDVFDVNCFLILIITLLTHRDASIKSISLCDSQLTQPPHRPYNPGVVKFSFNLYTAKRCPLFRKLRYLLFDQIRRKISFPQRMKANTSCSSGISLTSNFIVDVCTTRNILPGCWTVVYSMWVGFTLS